MSNISVLRCLFSTLFFCALTGSTWALSPAAVDAHRYADGKPVAKISGVEEILDWQALDEHQLLLQVSQSRLYRLTLGSTCYLPYAQHVGISRSENTIWAGFDYVTADGRQCSIRSIERL